MGRGWYRLGGGGGGNGGGEGGREVSSFNSQRKSRSRESSSNAASGCMAALFQFLDFHHFYFPSHHHHPTIDSPPKHPRGLVPPRNSLGLTEESPLSTTYKDKELLNVPMGFKVKTGGGATRLKLRAHAMETSSSSSEMGNSPGTKTPNLVARLMGLDLLPDGIDNNHSSPDLLHVMPSHRPTSRLTSHRLSLDSKAPGTRSLPESPRVSSARKSDFDIHRLSLQLNKENKYEELGCSRLRALKQEESPRAYAKQILNQIKERVVTRRIGMDITNTVKNREAEPGRKRYELKRNSAMSCSPSDRFPEKENKPSIKQKTSSQSTSRPDHNPQSPKIPSPAEQESLKRVKQKQLRPIKRCKEGNGETMSTPRPTKHSLTSNIQNRQEDVFFSMSRNSKDKHYSHSDKKRSNKTHVSNDLINISVAPIVPVKKALSPPATKLPQKQMNESQTREWERNSKALTRHGQTYKHEENLLQVARTPNLDHTTAIAATSTTTGGTGINIEQEYVTRILSYAGIRDTDSPVSSATWSSQPHPLDLSIFRNLEHLGQHPSGPLALRCNRRLLFDLANKILVGILNLHTRCHRNYNGSELVSKLCSSIASYPRVSFTNSEEIDALFAGKLSSTMKVEEEAEGIAAEIERDIVETLVDETTSDVSLYETKRRRIITHLNGVVSGNAMETTSNLPSPAEQESLKRVKQKQLRPIKRCKEGNGETMSTPRPTKHSLTSNIQNRQEDVFFSMSRNSKDKHYSHSDKKRSNKTHVSNDLINISVAPIVPVKKALSPPATKLPQKQMNESQTREWERNSKALTRHGQTYKHEENLLQVARTPNLDHTTAIAATSTTTGGTGINIEQEYVTRILSYAGIRDTDSPVSSATWSSQPHPLDLSIFRNLEHLGQHPSGPLALRCNRRLLFDLANKILVGILNLHTRCHRNYNGSELVSKLCSSIASYPRVSFTNSEEIDALFAGKLSSTMKVEEEAEGIAAEIERDIVETLVDETTSDVSLYETKRRRIITHLNGVVSGNAMETTS
ncbi:PREDICTED: uncharacterized protein LOC104798744 [Tarenaya hassleriana]|uniref:uncharacterized protein LOC104798744 n=1 Tax=Tarenaya hassleriana TaxID=28532 RepID=UPI00053C1F3D|nr:PREDICTED: uncharacterized protein LOC104798744 [Tarenaya hassleriana]